MEVAWAVLLAFALSDERVRLFAGLLVAKWVLSYFAFLFVGEWAPVLTDVAVGTVAVPFAMRSSLKRVKTVAFLFVLFLPIHGLYWSTWSAGLWFPVPYYYALSLVFSLMVLVLCPWERVHVHRIMGLLARFRVAFGTAMGVGPRSRARKPARSVTS